MRGTLDSHEETDSQVEHCSFVNSAKKRCQNLLKTLKNHQADAKSNGPGVSSKPSGSLNNKENNGWIGIFIPPKKIMVLNLKFVFFSGI